jgi:hypothetical protein
LNKQQVRALRATGRDLVDDQRGSRPETRGDCKDIPRPCPFISCRWHLYLDVSPRTGSIKLNFPDLEPHELAVSCALDVAEAGGASQEYVGLAMNLCRERIRQLERKIRQRISVGLRTPGGGLGSGAARG